MPQAEQPCRARERLSSARQETLACGSGQQLLLRLVVVAPWSGALLLRLGLMAEVGETAQVVDADGDASRVD